MGRNPFTGERRIWIGAVAVVAMVLVAGCNGLGGQSLPTSTASATTDGTTQAPAANGTTASATGDAASPNATTGASVSSGESAGVTTGGSAGVTNASGANGSAIHGSMTVVLGSKWRDLSGGNADVHFVRGDRVWYRYSDGVTISQALRTQNITLTRGRLTANGTTYDASEPGTYVQVRANGKPVDPQTYTLAPGDSIWIATSTPRTNFDPPGTYIHEADDHVHGTMNVTIDGKRVDFAKPKFQGRNRYFHFENNRSNPWHAHSWDVTLAYAMRTLGFDVSPHSVTYDGQTYRNGDPGTTVKVLVNGKPVDPAHYRLMDGDHVRIVVTQNGG